MSGENRDSRKLADAFGFVDDKYLDLVENEQRSKRPIWFYGGIAAAFLICMLTVFSVGVIAADWFGLRSLLLPQNTQGPGQENDESSYDDDWQGRTDDEISLSGYWESPETQALYEWENFVRSYDPDGQIAMENDKNPIGFEDRYLAYTVYTQEMADKLEEIAQKYGLKLHTKMNLVWGEEFAYRLGGKFWLDGNKAYPAYLYEDGSFGCDGNFSGRSDADVNMEYQLRRAVKGTLDAVALNVNHIEDYEEWQYQTADGERVMLALGPYKGLIYGDFDSCFISVNVLEGTKTVCNRRELEQIADSFDFTVLKNVQTPDMRGDCVPGKEWLGEDSETTSLSIWDKYYETLFNLRYLQRWPDGTDCEYEGGRSSMADNTFAILDVDRDGAEELVIRYFTSAMAWKSAKVYGFDESTGNFYEELWEFPFDITFYDNGIVTAGLSHNHGPVCDSLWPYTVWQYNEAFDSYELVCTVYGFDQKLAEELGIDTYPKEVDTDNYGTVYYIMREGIQDQAINRENYEKWYQETIGEAGKIEVPYQKMTDENIEAVKNK